jgi:subtilisin-like proprotein convertase family protein
MEKSNHHPPIISLLMKKTTLLILSLLHLAGYLKAQQFPNLGPVAFIDGASFTCGSLPGSLVTSDINVPMTGTIVNPSAVVISVNLSHTWVGDIQLELVAPDGTSCYLMNRIGNGTCGSNSNFNSANTLNFSSAYTTSIPTGNTNYSVPAGNYAPTVGNAGGSTPNLGTFLTGKQVNGNWTLRGRDVTMGDVGQITNWSFTIGPGVLPVRIVSFHAIKESDKKVRLNWEVAEQDQIKEYIIERSENAIDFKQIASITANSQSIYVYNSFDAAPANGNNYYRIRIKELSGLTTLSEIRTVSIKTSTGISVYPNPATDKIVLNIFSEKNGSGTIKICSMDGRMLIGSQYSIQQGSKQLNIDLQTIPRGNYIIITHFPDSKMETYKFIKH